MYNLEKVAKILGLSKRTIQRDVATMSLDVRNLSLTCPTDTRNYTLTEYGLQWLADKHGITLEADEDIHTDDSTADENSLVSSLLEQLRQKDLQIAEKDKQIAQLMEQAKNFQVLLQAQQVLSFPALKRSIFKRLFGSKSEQ
nr:unnamed protein product [uncultured bacterium]